MKKYGFILIIAIFSFVACSQKEEKVETTKRESIISKPITMANKTSLPKSSHVVVNKAPITSETVSKSYLETMQNELKKMEETVEVQEIKEVDSTLYTPTLVVATPNPIEEKAVVSVPEHIKNSTIKSVPR